MSKEKHGRGPEGVYSGYEAMECRIRKEAIKRAEAMDKRIIAEGYIAIALILAWHEWAERNRKCTS